MIAYNHDLTSMIDEYAKDQDYACIICKRESGKSQGCFSLHDNFLLYVSQLCITKNIRGKAIYECHAPPYVGHHGIKATT